MQIPIDPKPLRPDVADFLQKRQTQLKITTSTMTPSGNIIDWVPIESQTTEPIATPPTTSHAASPDPEHPTASVTFDVGEPGPAGHVPILRPDLSRITEGKTVEEVLSKRGGLLLNNSLKREPTDPNPAGYFHATSAQTVQCYGCDAWLNLWDPLINQPSSPGDDHSISQTWLQNYDNPKAHWHSIEGGLTVDKNLNGDLYNHIFIYYTTNFYTQDGNNLGGYNRIYQGWVQTHPTLYPGIRINGSSQQGVSPQLEIGIKFQLQAGKWWFGFNNNENGPWIWLGYYPASLFSGGIANHASWASFGGEVYSALANPCATTDQMGSGRHANQGWTHAAYQRLLHTQSNINGTTVNFNGAPEVDTAAAKCPAGQYSIQTFMNSGGNWGSYQYFGGQS